MLFIHQGNYYYSPYTRFTLELLRSTFFFVLSEECVQCTVVPGDSHH
jgi:hypothetical protein